MTGQNPHPGSTSSNNTSNSTSSSTSQSFQDPAALEIQRQTLQQQIAKDNADHEVAIRNGDIAQQATAANNLARHADLLAQLNSAAALQASGNVFTGGQNDLNRQATAQNQQAQDAATLARQQSQNVFTAGQSQNQNAFTAGESALSRAAQAGQFAATYAIQRAQQEAQQRTDQLNAAKTFTDLSASPDLTGFSRFMAAGGGSLGGAIQRGANSFTPLGQLGAARALQTAQETPRALPDYVYNPGVNPYLNAGGYVPPAAAPPPPVAAAPVAAAPTVSTQPVPDQWAGPTGETAHNTMAAPTANDLYAQINAQSPGGQAAGGVAPRYALGTMGRQLGRRSREPVTAAPSGASIDSVSDRFALGTMPARRLPVGPLAIDANADIPPGFALGTQPAYAHGTFMTGDSTDPADPAAGGAHPEDISLSKDANDQPQATVTPMVPPGVGDTEPDADDSGSDPGSIGALLIAIGNFLNAQEEKEPSGPPAGYALGAGPRRAVVGAQLGMPKGMLGRMARYDLGTDPSGAGLTTDPGIMASDVPYLNQVTGMRLATPYSVNPYASDFQNQSPTQRAIGASAFQTATGVPGSEIGFEAQKYAPGGLAQGSQYHRELQLGL